MTRIKEIKNDGQMEQELKSAGAKLVVADFHASWCGPCKNIAPVYIQLSKTHTNVVFLKIDVDDCGKTAEKYNVTAMPTFIFFKSMVEVDRIKGADPNVLKEKVQQHGGGETSSEEVPGYSDLHSFILEAGCNCLNESDDHTHKNVFKDDKAYLESDCDEQLMFTISFNQAVKVHSLKIVAPDDGSGPKTIKIFVNQPNEVDFDSGERMEGVQKLVLEESDITGDKIIPLRFVKFQNVNNIVIFVVDNQGGDDITKITYLKLIGVPCDATNMNDFKRVAGKAGESHSG